METSREVAVAGKISRRSMWLGVVLLVAGLLGHLLAAYEGGGGVAYTHHLVGFFGVSLVSGAIIAGLGWLFWRGRHDITLLILGTVQALFGLYVYISFMR